MGSIDAVAGNPSRLTTILLDCDNTLVLSETLAFAGCADLINRVCASQSLTTSPDPSLYPAPPFTGAQLMRTFVGQNFRGMLGTLVARYGLELSAAEVDDLVRQEEDVVIAKLRSAPVQPCSGVVAALDDIVAHGIPSGGPDGSRTPATLAVVSSSALRRVVASLETADLMRYFPALPTSATTPDAAPIYSAATSLATPTSKPDPAVYLFAMASLGKVPAECVAVEDSRSGARSASGAGMRVVGYVGPYVDEGEEKVKEMDAVLREAGAGVVMRDWSEFGKCLVELQRAPGKA